MNSPEKLSSAGTTPNKQVRGADRPSDHRGWPPEQPWLKVRTGVAKSPDTCGSHAGIYKAPNRPSGRCRLCAVQAFCCRANSLRPSISITEGWSDQRERNPKENATCRNKSHFLLERLMGVEPTYAAWEAAVLPMNYSRVCFRLLYQTASYFATPKSSPA